MGVLFGQDINRYLRAYVHLHHLMHAWIVIEAKNIDYVYVWRLEAEEAMRAAGKDSLSDEQ
ncbi:GLYK, partial [Symbiodinium microadriaticum]